MKWLKASAFALVGGGLVAGLSFATGLEHIWGGALVPAAICFVTSLRLDSLKVRE